MKLPYLLLAVGCWLSTVSAVPLWVRTYGDPYRAFDEVHAIGADDSGNVIVSGFSEVSSSDAEFVTIKYKPNGDTAWLRRYNPANGQNGATALAIDHAGNVIVTGYQGDPTSAYGEWQTLKYSAAGESLWAATWGYGGYCRASGIVADTAGNTYVTGKAGSLNYLDFAVIKYDPSGNLAWPFIYDGGDNDMANAVAVDLEGNVYATGYTVLSGNYGNLLTMKISPTGESLWKNIYANSHNRGDRGVNIAVDNSGSAVVSGVVSDTSGHTEYITVKYAPSGDTVWTRLYHGPGNQSDNAMALVLDAAGNAYVTGSTWADASHYDFTTIKYAPGGTERWIAHYPGASHRAFADAIGLDVNANLYVTGYSYDSTGGSDVVTVKYDSAGNQRWAERYAGPFGEDEAYMLAVGPDSSVFVGGRTNSDSGGMDYLALKYGAAGAVEERSTPDASRSTPNASIVRGVLELALDSRQHTAYRAELLDAAGRRVAELRPGRNDVGRLVPGVYFVKGQGPGGAGQGEVRKVVLTR